MGGGPANNFRSMRPHLTVILRELSRETQDNIVRICNQKSTSGRLRVNRDTRAANPMIPDELSLALIGNEPGENTSRWTEHDARRFR